METDKNTSQFDVSLDYLLADPKPGIGGVFAIPDDTFKISLEEAIDFMKSYRCSIEEKLQTLQAIATKLDCEKRAKGLEFDNKALRFEEIKAQSTIDQLKLESNRWFFGNTGISLAKTKSN